MSRTSFDGSVTVITGAGSGIGRATALLAAQRGATLVLTDVVPDTLAETVRLVEAAGGGEQFGRACERLCRYGRGHS